MKIAVAQINSTIGDFEGNTKKILDRLAWAEKAEADLLLFPELAVCGYPPQDLLFHPSFIDRCTQAVRDISEKTSSTAVVLGYPSVNTTSSGRAFFNAAGFFAEGKMLCEHQKALLPNYDVFDEKRYFEPGTSFLPCEWKGKKLGLSICEDMWSSYTLQGKKLYRLDPLQELVNAGADIILNLSASPYSLEKIEVRHSLLSQTAKRLSRPIFFCNLVGGNDSLIFDGNSLVVNAQGEIVHEGQRFVEDNFLFDLKTDARSVRLPEISPAEEMRKALVLGLRDYVHKCGFSHVVIGLSGGIDSAVVAALAVEALGSEHVTGILMPSPYTLQQSMDDAQALANLLSIKTEVHPINAIYDAYRNEISSSKEITVVEENLQARIRGNILMAFSNRTGAMVLSTGNKSELSVGYCTLYGDMAGGLSVIADVPKTFVYKIARVMNDEHPVIPPAILERPPSAELKPDQKDEDVLPPYDILDQILKAYIEEQKSIPEIVRMGFDARIVTDVARRVDRNEYKRRQAAPGLKVTSKAFGTGRRMPIAWKS
ncbi:MAG: NAD+ synthase [Deltaproteobacteria bacterium RIFCSPLOWO2_02_FULL_44_10]|nr:MAG: NAD+ synthase [Deltaproteobacteria bacterium RIFCSPHIGHO2_02_FULL_44_16]OGQ46635.1 MAG: NAD+ synthase [Deltaproteobacteria bacterium RIFCSPLOWO2_02_FULL_44_10]